MQVLDYLRTVPDSLGGGVDLDGMSMSSSPDSWNTVMIIMVRLYLYQWHTPIGILLNQAECVRQRSQQSGPYTRIIALSLFPLDSLLILGFQIFVYDF